MALEHPSGNRILDALPKHEFEQLIRDARRVDVALHETLLEADQRRTHLYFPTSGIFSMLMTLSDGRTSEVALMGAEGMVGLSLFLGTGAPARQVTVQVAGNAIEVPGEAAQHAYENLPTLQRCLLQLFQTILAQTAQTALCNRHHTVDQQLARWLLMCLDRLEGDRIIMTHDLIAQMLGVRREGVTVAAGRLQGDNIIQYRRGDIQVLNRDALEGRACECYGAMRTELARYLEALKAG